jgi:hypothetical protein
VVELTSLFSPPLPSSLPILACAVHKKTPRKDLVGAGSPEFARNQMQLAKIENGNPTKSPVDVEPLELIRIHSASRLLKDNPALHGEKGLFSQ